MDLIHEIDLACLLVGNPHGKVDYLIEEFPI